MCLCFDCEMCVPEIIFTQVQVGKGPFAEIFVKEEQGFRCGWNAVESTNIYDLEKGGCRLKG